MKLPSRNQVAAVVFIAGGFIFALAFIPMALEILQAGELTYDKTDSLPRTVSPENGAFEFYYQAAFLLTLGIYPLMFSIGGILAIVAIGLGKLGVAKTSLALRLPAFMSIIAMYLGIAIGFAWIVLLFFRYRLLS
jgi:hypothetical protein